MDYANTSKLRNSIVPEERLLIGDIEFRINRKYEDDRIVKTIDFEVDGRQFSFSEKVQHFDRLAFKTMFAQAGLTIEKFYGDHQLGEFDESTSDRLIIYAVKQA